VFSYFCNKILTWRGSLAASKYGVNELTTAIAV